MESVLSSNRAYSPMGLPLCKWPVVKHMLRAVGAAIITAVLVPRSMAGEIGGSQPCKGATPARWTTTERQLHGQWSVSGTCLL